MCVGGAVEVGVLRMGWSKSHTVRMAKGGLLFFPEIPFPSQSSESSEKKPQRRSVTSANFQKFINLLDS